MEICKNNCSNMYFIYIEKTGDEEALLVTPEAQVKSLKLNLFSELEDQEESYLLEKKIVTEAQVKRFREYLKDRSTESVENMEDSFEQLSSSAKAELLKKMHKKVNGN